MDLFAFNTLLFLLSFIGCCAGQGILPEGPVYAILGRNVTFKTLVDKPVYVFIIWNFHDGTEAIPVRVATVGSAGLNVNTPYEGRVSINKTNGELFLGGLTSEDSGDYLINIVTADGNTKIGETQLRVLEPVSDVVIKSNMPEAIEYNSTVVLTCSAKGSFLKFTWLRGAAPIVADGKHITLKEEDLSSNLTFTGVLRKDLVGPIYCTAANKLETEKSAPFNLTVYYGPEEVTMSPANPPQYIRTGSNFNLSCSARSSPPARFYWYHDEQMMEFMGPVLTLKTITEHGYGKKMAKYSCRASNEKTKRMVPSPAVSFVLMEAITGAKLSGPTKTLIAGNSTANISCQATAGTVETRNWLKDGKPLSAGGRLVFSADKSSVMISPLQKEDNGEYTCQLVNPVNSDKAAYKMVVNYGPEAVAVTGKDAVELEDKVMLICTAASVPPANFTWKFNDTMTKEKTARFTIEAARYKDNGKYTCEAFNDVTGKTSAFTHTLSVQEEILPDGLSDGAIAGIVIAILVALGAAIALIVYCRQKVPVESPY